jgi:hypothetical protein
MKLIHLVGLVGLALAVGCGSSNTAALYLYDAAPAGVTAVNVFVKSMDVHVDTGDTTSTATDSRDPADTTIDNDGKWETLDVNKSIDLLQHQGETAADLLGQVTLPDGKVTQLRLVIDPAQPNTATFADGSTCNLDTTLVARTGIKINHVFKAFQTKDGHADVFVHFDLDHSLVAEGTCFSLRPVLQLENVKQKGKPVDLTPGRG